MNTKLVESLVQIIQSLTPEEQALLSTKLKLKNNWQEEYQKLLQLRARVFTRRGEKPFDPPLDEYIQITRDERTAQQDEVIRHLRRGEEESIFP